MRRPAIADRVPRAGRTVFIEHKVTRTPEEWNVYSLEFKSLRTPLGVPSPGMKPPFVFERLGAPAVPV